MKITLIKPSLGSLNSCYNLNRGSMEPLQLAVIAGLTEEQDEVQLYDDRVEDIPFDETTDLVAITVDSYSALRAYQISSEFRKRGVPIVLGGIHVSVLPEEAMLHADAIVIGDAEPVWHQLINDFKARNLQKIYSGSFGLPQEGCFPRRDLFKGKNYLPVSLVQFSRGCNFNCTFCSVSRLFKLYHKCRKIDDVLYEIERDNLKTIIFVDDNMAANREELKIFLKELIPLKVRWANQSSIDMVNDNELLRLMADSGCFGNLIGFESININTLKLFNKSPNLRDFNYFKEAMAKLRDHGFLTWASFIIGNDSDNLDSIKETFDFAIKNKFSFAFLNILMPNPGTSVYNQFKDEGRLLYNNQWWIHPDYRYNQAAYIPRLMSPDQLTEALVIANKDLYSLSSITHRLFDLKTNMRSILNFLIYTRINYILRKTSI